MKIQSLSQLPNKTISAESFSNETTETKPSRILDDAIVSSDIVIKEPTSVNTTRVKPSIEADIEYDDTLITVSNFRDSGYIRITGDYKQNYVDYRKIDITNLKVVDGTTFRFLLSIKQTSDDSNPTLYTSKKFYDELISTYTNNNPYFIPAATKQEAIVVIELAEIKQKVEGLHGSELNSTADNGVLVLKNLFVNSNFTFNSDAPSETEYKTAKSNPTYNIEDVVRYIDWVVSKPNPNYDERLINTKLIGRWKYANNLGEVIDSSIPNENELPNNLNNPTTFPPFGRPGDYQNETDFDDDDNEWLWDINKQQWVQLTTTNSDETPPPIDSPNPYVGATAPGGGYSSNSNTTSNNNSNNSGGGGIDGDS